MAQELHIFILSRKHKQFNARRKRPCSLLAPDRIPWESYSRHRGSRERENSQVPGTREQGGDMLEMIEAAPRWAHSPPTTQLLRWPGYQESPHAHPSISATRYCLPLQTPWLWPAARSSPTSHSIPCLQLFPISLGNSSENN